MNVSWPPEPLLTLSSPPVFRLSLSLPPRLPHLPPVGIDILGEKLSSRRLRTRDTAAIVEPPGLPNR